MCRNRRAGEECYACEGPSTNARSTDFPEADLLMVDVVDKGAVVLGLCVQMAVVRNCHVNRLRTLRQSEYSL